MTSDLRNRKNATSTFIEDELDSYFNEKPGLRKTITLLEGKQTIIFNQFDQWVTSYK